MDSGPKVNNGDAGNARRRWRRLLLEAPVLAVALALLARASLFGAAAPQLTGTWRVVSIVSNQGGGQDPGAVYTFSRDHTASITGGRSGQPATFVYTEDGAGNLTLSAMDGYVVVHARVQLVTPDRLRLTAYGDTAILSRVS